LPIVRSNARPKARDADDTRASTLTHPVLVSINRRFADKEQPRPLATLKAEVERLKDQLPPPTRG
jgi:hypothetical protein